jgi:HEAT repeat protein
MSSNVINLDDLQYELCSLEGSKLEANSAGIQTLLGDRESLVRFESARALGKLGKSSLEPLRGRLALEKDDLVLSEIICQLGDLDDEESIGEIEKIYSEHPSHIVRSAAVNALVDLIGVDAEEFLIASLQTDRSRRVRASIACALAWLGSTVGVNAIRHSLKSRDQIVRGKIGTLLDYYLPVENRKELIAILSEAMQRETLGVVQKALQGAIDSLEQELSTEEAEQND